MMKWFNIGQCATRMRGHVAIYCFFFFFLLPEQLTFSMDKPHVSDYQSVYLGEIDKDVQIPSFLLALKGRSSKSKRYLLLIYKTSLSS